MLFGDSCKFRLWLLSRNAVVQLAPPWIRACHLVKTPFRAHLLYVSSLHTYVTSIKGEIRLNVCSTLKSKKQKSNLLSITSTTLHAKVANTIPSSGSLRGARFMTLSQKRSNLPLDISIALSRQTQSSDRNSRDLNPRTGINTLT